MACPSSSPSVPARRGDARLDGELDRPLHPKPEWSLHISHVRPSHSPTQAAWGSEVN